VDRIGFGTGVDTTALMDDLIEALVFWLCAQLLSQALELGRLLAFWASSGQLSVSDFDSAFDGLAAQPTALKKGL
jgi:hypothetical protein